MHVIKSGTTDQIAYFRAYDDDGSPKVDLDAATAGLAIVVSRIGLTDVSVSSPSDKANPNDAHADGAIYHVSGNLYTIDLPDAAVATPCPSIVIDGSYTGGVIEGAIHPIVAYDVGNANSLGLSHVDENISDPKSLDPAYEPAKTAAQPSDVASAETNVINAVNAILAGIDRRIEIVTTGSHWERPDSGSVGIVLEIRTKDDEGDPIDIDLAADPAVGIFRQADDTDLSSDLSAVTKIRTGVWRLSYTLESTDSVEVLRIDVSGTVNSVVRQVSKFIQVTDATAVDFTQVDRDKLNALHDVRLTETRANNLDSVAQSGGAMTLTEGERAAIAGEVDTVLTASHGGGPWTGGGGSGLTGPNDVTISVVDDGTGTEIQNALVRLYRTGESGSKLTDVNGEAPFGVQSATFTVVISAAGYEGLVAPLPVGGDLTQEYRLTPSVTNPPSDPSLCSIAASVRKANGQPIEGATIQAKVVDENSSIVGSVVSTGFVEYTTDSNGLVTLELIRQDQFTSGSGTYLIEVFEKRTRVFSIEVTIPNQATSQLDLVIP